MNTDAYTHMHVHMIRVHVDVGLIFDSDLSSNSHITSICKAANFQVYRISTIKKYLTPEALKTAVHSLVSSKTMGC